MRVRPNTLLTLVTVALTGVACAGSSATTVTKTVSGTRDSRAGAAGVVLAAVGRSLPTRQVTLVGHVNGRVGGYRAVVSVTDAERSLTNPGAGILLRVRGGVGVPEIGSLHVTCGATPHSRFVFTRTALGEGPPRIYHETTPTSGRTSIGGLIGSTSGFTNSTGRGIPEPHPTREIIDHYEIFLGGEAFQYSATITDLLVPTRTRCDLLSEATVVEHAAGLPAGSN